MATSLNDTSDLALGGLSLEQYAGVTIALAEKFPLLEILAQEGIDSEVWTAASRAWIQAIADAPDLHILFLQKRRIAEDCLARPISPVDEDPGAWVGLLGALALSENPSSMVEALGITMSDLARLGRLWKRKMEADPKLNKHIEDLAPTAVPPKSVKAGPLELRPFPWSPPRGTPTLESKDAPSPNTLSQDARTNLANEPPRRHLASFQIRAQESSAPSALAQENASVLTPAVPARPAPLPRAVEQSQKAKGPPEIVTEPLDSDAFDAARKPATPFEAPRAVEIATSFLDDRPPAEQAPTPPELSIEQYAWVVATLRKTPAAGLPEVLARLRLTRETRDALDARWAARMAAEPGLSETLAAAVKRHLFAAPPPAAHVARPTVALSPHKLLDPADETAIAAGPLVAPLPFAIPAVPPADTKPSRDPRPVGMRRGSGTEMAGGVARGIPVTLPFGKSGSAHGGLNQPGWTVERYGELCIDLYVSGLPEAQVLAAAGLTKEQYKLLDQYWNAEMQRDPALRERWTSASARRRGQLK